MITIRKSVGKLQTFEHLSRLMTQPTKWHVRPAKTQISLGIRPVWSESSLCAQWEAKEQSGCPGWSESSLGAHAILLVFVMSGSFLDHVKSHAIYMVYSAAATCFITDIEKKKRMFKLVILLIAVNSKHASHSYSNILSGAVARLKACPLGMQAAPSSIPMSGTFFRGDLVMKRFLRPFSLFRWFEKSSCQLLAKECALSTGKLPRRLAQ